MRPRAAMDAIIWELWSSCAAPGQRLMGFTAPDEHNLGRHWQSLIATPSCDSLGPAGAGFSAGVASSGAVKPMQQRIQSPLHRGT